MIWTVEGTPVVDGVAASPYSDSIPYAATNAIRVACSRLYNLLGARRGTAFAHFMHEAQLVDRIVAGVKAAYRAPLRALAYGRVALRPFALHPVGASVARGGCRA